MMFSEDDDVDDHEIVEDNADEAMDYEENDDGDDASYYDSYELEYLDDNCESFTDLGKKHNGAEMLSLQDICLISISKNIFRFNLAFSTIDDSNFRRNLYFLQKFHSSYLIKAISEDNGNLDESYFHFLLNQHIKEFDMDVLFLCDWDIVINRMSEIGHGFQEVRFNFPEISEFEKVVDFVNKVVCHLSNVKKLHLSPYCDDSTLEIVASSCLHLEELHIDNCSVTEKGLKSLCQENVGNVSLNLIGLSMSGVVCPYDGIAHLLQNMTSLEEINHDEVPYILHKMHKDSMNKTLERKYNLTSLVLVPIKPWEDAPEMIEILTLYHDVCPRIKIILLVLKSKEYLDLCFKFPELEVFYAINGKFDLNLDLNEFLKSKGGKLRCLLVNTFTLSVAVLVQNCPKLDSLILLNVTYQYLEPGTMLQTLNNLQKLTLGWFSLSDALSRRSVMEILNSSQKIEELTLESIAFEYNEEFLTRLSQFCKNKTMKHLKFTNCDVGYAFLQSVLLACSNLETLTVKCCYNISDIHIKNLREIQTKITWIDDRTLPEELDNDLNTPDVPPRSLILRIPKLNYYHVDDY